MNAQDLCLIIDNDREFLRDWLDQARCEGDCSLTGQQAAAFFRLKTGTYSGALRGSTLEGHVVRLITERIDWDDVAEHYAIKVAEGATVPKGD